MSDNNDFAWKDAWLSVSAAAAERCEELAARLLGNPSSAKRHEMRWGSHGKVVLSRTGNNRGLWFDFSTGKGGDLITLVSVVEGCTTADAFKWLQRELRHAAARAAGMGTGPARPALKGRAHRVGAPALCARQGRTVFAGPSLFRGPRPRCAGDGLVADPLRPACYFHAIRGRLPAVLLPFRNIASGEITGIHKTALNADGSGFRLTDGSKLKISAGGVLEAAVMLSRKVADTLCLCEGVETGLGILMGSWGLPVWALSGATFLARLQPVAGVKRLVIGADNDANGVGLEAARQCGRRWQRAGCRVEIRWPDGTDTDFADHFRRRAS